MQSKINKTLEVRRSRASVPYNSKTLPLRKGLCNVDQNQFARCTKTQRQA